MPVNTDAMGIQLCRSFPATLPATTGADPTILAPGEYTITGSVAFWLRITATSGAGGRAAIPSTVTAGGSQPTANGQVYVEPNQPYTFDVPPRGTWYFSTIADGSTAGTARLNGPFAHVRELT